MKRTILVVSIVLLCQPGTSSAALEMFNSSTVIGGGTFKTSKNVKLSATATTVRYSAIAGHEQGDKEFGTQHLDSKLYSRSKQPSTAATTCTTDTFDFSSWTAQ